MNKLCISLFAASLTLAACTHVNYYEGSDAALIPLSCANQTVSDATGKNYVTYNSIIEVDGTFTGSGGGCPNTFTYRIKPGLKRLRTVANLDNEANPYLLFGFVDVTADLKPNVNYALSISYTGSVLKVQVVEAATGKVVGEGETTEIRRSSKGNAALKVVPALIK